MTHSQSDRGAATIETQALMACLEVGKLLTSTLDLSKILDRIMTRMTHLIPAQNWSLLLRDERTGELAFEIVVGIDKERVRDIRLAPGEGVAGWVAQTGIPAFLPDARSDPRFNPKVDRHTGFTTRSIVCVPLSIHGKILGVIEIVNIADVHAFECTHLPLLTVLADYAAIAIENSRLFAEVERMSITDEYTGLYNARYLHRVLDERLSQARRRRSKLSLVFVDMDDFKRVVDRYGHLLGSRLLKEVGETMASGLRERDILVKYGGDEYVILLPDTDRAEAVRRMEEICGMLRVKPFLPAESPPARITASFGVAVFPDDADTAKELLLRADHALYRIKRCCKNGVGTVAGT